MYWLLSWSMPRAGGDYVWTGRILHPALGTCLNLTWVVFDCIFMGSFANYIFTYAFYSVFVSTGVLTNNPGMITWAEAFFTNNLWMVLLGTVFMVYLTLIMLPGVRFYLRQQIVFWTIGMFGTIVAIVILLGATPATFAVAFNAALGHYTTYENVISTAKSYGFT